MSVRQKTQKAVTNARKLNSWVSLTPASVGLEAFVHVLTVRIGGQPVVIGGSDWRTLANSERGPMIHRRFSEWSQSVLRHIDGRTVVYMDALRHDGTHRIRGLMLPAGDRDIRPALDAVTRDFNVDGVTAEGCDAQYKSV